MSKDDWWAKPRAISIVVDNPSWIIPYAEALVERLAGRGDNARLCRSYDDVSQGDIAFFLGCVGIASAEILALNRYNLVVHESDLPEGRGFAPVAWQILDGRKEIPVCLVEAAEEVDAGLVYLRSMMKFEGHELSDEIRDRQGRATEEVCLAFVEADEPPVGEPQQGEGSFFPRRRPRDSELDPAKTLLEQFELLRVVDNARYPAFFDHRGHRYRIRIDNLGPITNPESSE